MIDQHSLGRAADQFRLPEGAFERLLRRRARKERNRRIGAAVVAFIIATVGFLGLTRAFRDADRPADEPTPSPMGIFADVPGWIAYRYDRHEGPVGIWAVDPTRPNDPEARIQLSDRPGTPLAWSSDGSKLLIWRNRQGPVGTPDWTGLFVLNANGTETRVVTNNPKVGGGTLGWIAGGSFSPDGSEVVFAASGGMYMVDSDGGTPRLLSKGGGNPTFSPDGTKIAYFDFHDKTGNTLRVMNADGTGDRVVLDSQAVRCFLRPLLLRPAWFPDGTKIAFHCSRETGIQVVGADGSDLTTLIPGSDPYWAPDGSRIAFDVRVPRPLTQRGGQSERRLVIAHADGTHAQVFEHPALAGPWNPLLLSVPGEPNSTTTTGEVSPFVYAIVALGVVGVLFLAWRAKRRTPAR
jgi:hypothetical protein